MASIKLEILILAFQKFKLGTYFVVLLLHGTQEQFQILHNIISNPNFRRNIFVFFFTRGKLRKKLANKKK